MKPEQELFSQLLEHGYDRGFAEKAIRWLFHETNLWRHVKQERWLSLVKDNEFLIRQLPSAN